ncbi:MAG TPA: hypothetical protein VMU63_05565 [Acidimicrobiales bacterium]|nr:hypothetical protein [Acidimicrobiales bacterium]
MVEYVGTELSAAALAHYHHATGRFPNAPIPFWLWSRYLVPHFGTQGGALAYAAAILVAWWLVVAARYGRGLVLRV